MGKWDHIGSVIVRKPFQILNMNEKCNGRYTFQINRIPTWIPVLSRSPLFVGNQLITPTFFLIV
jgi:hypothetical protein